MMTALPMTSTEDREAMRVRLERAWAPLRPTEVFVTFWQFAAERQAIYFRRLRESAAPWTLDPVLQMFRFTNAYRAADRASQFLIRDVIHRGSQDSSELFFRIVLFRLFNRIETWERIQEAVGTPTATAYSFVRYDEVLSDALSRREAIYSPAYIIPSAQGFGYPRKHQNALRLLETMLDHNLPEQVTEASSLKSVFELVRSFPSFGDFLAYQLTIDINYSRLISFPESSFVVAGPGARDGISKCFVDTAGLQPEDVITLVAERQTDEFARLELDFQSLWGRPLQLVDCQNLFSEVDKYARATHPSVAGRSHRSRIKRRFRPAEEDLPDPWFPPKWRVDPSLT